MALATLGFGLLIDLPADKSWARIIIFQIIVGIGIGPNFQAAMIAVQSSLKPADMAAGTAMFGVMRNLSSAISVVIGGVIVQNRMAAHRDELLASGISGGLVEALVNG